MQHISTTQAASGHALVAFGPHGGSSSGMRRLGKDILGRMALTPLSGDLPWKAPRLVYADYAASGRMLGSIEAAFADLVAPIYANTHTEASACGEVSSALYEHAREVISEELNAPSHEFAVIFTGAGATGAIDKFSRMLAHHGLRPRPRSNAAALTDVVTAAAAATRPVVFVGPYEHHSNEVMWREMECDLVVIREDAAGRICLVDLERQLAAHASRLLKLGSFSAGSNVTGILSDVDAIASLLHAHGAIAAFDYAAAGPHVAIDMCPSRAPAAAKDAVFLSPHKMLGGPGACGVLVVRRSLVGSTPTVPGGGTVLSVDPERHDYLTAVEAREEGGTPPILGALRAGAAFGIHAAIGPEAIRTTEARMRASLFEAWQRHPNIHLIGADRPATHDHDRCSPILSFRIAAPLGVEAPGGGQLWLHHYYVCRLLSDLYGIQARSGCSCAGPYGTSLLNIKSEEWHALRAALRDGAAATKPGWVRVSLCFAMSEAEVAYIREAVLQVASCAWRLLPLYDMDAATGMWRCRAPGQHAVATDDAVAAFTGLAVPGAHDKRRSGGAGALVRALARVMHVGRNAKQAARFNSHEAARCLHRQLVHAQGVYKQAQVQRLRCSFREAGNESVSGAGKGGMCGPQPEGLRWWLTPCEAATLLGGLRR